MVIYGINPVVEALRAGHVTSVAADDPADPRLRPLVALAKAAGVPVRRQTETELARAAGVRSHQGVVAQLAAPRAQTLDELISIPGTPLLVVLDGIEDPQNVGAILRTADAAGVTGVVRQSRRAARLGGAVAKASAGAVAHVRMATVVNIARSLDAMKERDIWTVGLAADAPDRYDRIDLTLPTALVLGAEGKGLRRLVQGRCDRLVSIPMVGRLASLNVSVAAGIVLFEAVRQRSGSGGARPAGRES